MQNSDATSTAAAVVTLLIFTPSPLDCFDGLWLVAKVAVEPAPDPSAGVVGLVDDTSPMARGDGLVREASHRDERVPALGIVRVDLSQLVRQLTDQTDLDGQRLELALGRARVVGDRDLLRTMAANLIDNAVRHNSAAGWIEIRTDSAGQEAQLEISTKLVERMTRRARSGSGWRPRTPYRLMVSRSSSTPVISQAWPGRSPSVPRMSRPPSSDQDPVESSGASTGPGELST
jgi:hypothetical protein